MSRTIAGRYVLDESLRGSEVGPRFAARSVASDGFSRKVFVIQLATELSGEPAFVSAYRERASQLMGGPHFGTQAVLDIVVDEEQTFVVVEPVSGPTLRQWVEAHHADGAPAPWAHLLAICGRSLQALQVLHDRGLAHGGISATTIQIDRTGQSYLTHYGIAAACEAAEVGPKSLRALDSDNAVSPGGDLFAMGLVLYTVLAGGSDPSVLPDDLRARLFAGNPVDLSLVREDVPAVVLRTVERAMSANPRERFESASAMARSLDLILRSVAQMTDPAAIAGSVRTHFGKRSKRPPPGLAPEETDQLDLKELRQLRIDD